MAARWKSPLICSGSVCMAISASSETEGMAKAATAGAAGPATSLLLDAAAGPAASPGAGAPAARAGTTT
eukprot:5808159-Pyramimonas_sp.AAC.1